MKFIFFIVLMFSVVSGAHAEQNHDLKRVVLDDMLAEGHISQLEYNQKTSMLNVQETKRQFERQANHNEILLKSGPAGTSSISGTIELNSIGVLDVYVVLRDFNTGGFVDQRLTDAMGDYTFTDLAAGSYYVTVEDYYDDYINVMWSAFGTDDCMGWCQAGNNNEITLADATGFVDVDIDVVIGASISGNVTSGGLPVDGIYVTITESNYDYSVGAQTNAMGNYVATGLPAGDYFVRAQDVQDIYIDAIWSNTGTEQCTNCEPDVDNYNALVLGVNTPNIDLNLTVGATLTGQITDAVTSAAVETLEVSLYDPLNLNNGFFFTQFDGSGNYTINGIPQGDYKVYLSPKFEEDNDYIPEIYNNIPCNLCANMITNGAGDMVTLTNGATTNNIDFALNTGASISGVISNAAYPAETVEQLGLVYVFNVTNRLIATRFFEGTASDPMFDGSFRIGGLLPGTYFVQGGDLGREFFQRELYNDVRCPWSGCDRGAGGEPINLGANEQRLGIDFDLEYGGKISGTVTDAMSGMPLTNTINNYVQFYDAAGLVAGGAGIRPDGTYTSQRALPPGTYSVRTGSMFGGWLSAPYVMQKYDPMGNIDCPGVTCDLTTGNVVVPAYVRQMPRDPVAEAAAATVTGIDFALSPAFSFSGTITEFGSATPIPDVHVLVFDDLGNFANWATTDAMGNFTVSGLPAGEYRAVTNNGSNLPFMGFFPQEVGGWIDILYDGQACPGSACDIATIINNGTPIVLGAAPFSEGTEPTLDFTMNAGGTLTGKINTFGSSLPAQYVDVNVYNSSGVFYGSYPSDSAGFYMTAGLPEGTYYLTTSNDGGLVNSKYGGDYCIEGACDPLDAVPVVIAGNQSLVDIDFDLRTDYLFKSGLD